MSHSRAGRVVDWPAGGRRYRQAGRDRRDAGATVGRSETSETPMARFGSSLSVTRHGGCHGRAQRVLVESVTFAFLEQRLAADAEDLGGHGLLAAGVVEHLGDVGALQLF